MHVALWVAMLALIPAVRPLPQHCGDFYPRWYGTRALILEARNPYSAEVSSSIQNVCAGHAMQAGEQGDQHRFGYPLYTVFLLAPFGVLPYPAASILMLVILLAAIGGATLVWIRALGLKFPWLIEAAMMVGTVVSFPALQLLNLIQLSGLVFLFVAAAALAIARHRFIAAGALLALATIKPQLALLPVALACLWTVYRWKERKLVVLSLGITILLCCAAAAVLLPSWIPDFVAGLRAYRQYAGDVSWLTFFAGRIAGSVAGLIILPALVWKQWDWLRDPAEFPSLLAVVMAASVFVMPLMALYNALLLVPIAIILGNKLWLKSRVALPEIQPRLVTR